jgi:hypothetical protein
VSFGIKKDLWDLDNALNVVVLLMQNYGWLLLNALLTNGGQLM